MSERTQEHHAPHGLPRARVERSYLTWSLWLIPAIAAAVVGYFIIYDLFLSGPAITIYFKNADGLQAKNTMVKYRGIKVGEVKSLKLTDHGEGVMVTARLNSSAAELAREGSKFWVVRPELKLGSVTGLRTIVAGNFITVEPGDGPRTNKFVGWENAPIPRVKAIYITLLTGDLDSLQEQTPIFYRGVQVGEVTEVRLGMHAQHVIVTARIRQDFAPLVRTNSVFWNAGGIHVHAGLLNGVQISAESAQTVISGGIAFATPDDYGPEATNGDVFVLNEKESDDWKKWDPDIPLLSPPPAENKRASLLGNSK